METALPAPAAKVRSSKLIQFPAAAWEARLMVHEPPDTVAVTDIWNQSAPGVTGIELVWLAPPQFFSPMAAEVWPPPERTQTFRVYAVAASPVSVCVVSTV